MVLLNMTTFLISILNCYAPHDLFFNNWVCMLNVEFEVFDGVNLIYMSESLEIQLSISR